MLRRAVLSHPRLLRGQSIRAGTNDVFDEPPSNSDNTFGYESGAVNPRGKHYWLELAKAW